MYILAIVCFSRKGLRRVLARKVRSSKTVMNYCRRMAALKDCHQRLLKDSSDQTLPKWWLSSKTVIKDCRSYGCLERVSSKTAEKTPEKTAESDGCLQRQQKRLLKDMRTWRKKFCKSSLPFQKCMKSILQSIFFCPGRRERTSGFDNPLVTSCWSDVQNCGKTHFFCVAERPSCHFVLIGRWKLW